MPIGRKRISLIPGSLVKVKIRSLGEWWFSTSSNGGFGPEPEEQNLTTDWRW